MYRIEFSEPFREKEVIESLNFNPLKMIQCKTAEKAQEVLYKLKSNNIDYLIYKRVLNVSRSNRLLNIA